MEMYAICLLVFGIFFLFIAIHSICRPSKTEYIEIV